MRFRDDVIREEPVRVAYLWMDATAATTRRRNWCRWPDAGQAQWLATEIIKGVILPQFVILPLAVLLVMDGAGTGIRPLADLQQRIRQREFGPLMPSEDTPRARRN